MSESTSTISGFAERATLHFRQGGSDKVYKASVEPSGPGYVVNVAYGRRGGPLRPGTKTPTPVGYDQAKSIYDRLVREKLAKGYSPAAGSDPLPQLPAGHALASGVLPQLLNPIDESLLPGYLGDDHWWVQQKFDGCRLLVRKDGDTVTGINRRGLIVAVPVAVMEAALELEAERCLLDGELVSDTLYHAFDLLESGMDLRPSPYAVRYGELMNLVDAVSFDAIRYAFTATHTNAKRSMVERLHREGHEGVVLKDRDAAYAPGRPASGGPQLKCKFYATASFLVGAKVGRPDRRSVGLELVGLDARAIPMGNVTVPANWPVPAAGSVVEVRYLYAYPGGGLCQPVYLGPRRDVAASECRVGQLKFKPASGDEADDEDGEPTSLRAAG